MLDDFEDGSVKSSGELWSEICSTLPPQSQNQTEAHAEDAKLDFGDSFQPGHTHRTCPPESKWEPMEDSEMYIASLENRLKRVKGQSSDVTSRDMLRSLSQAKKECWDRFLHDSQTSELFQGGDLDDGALEHFKRWLVPEKVAISAEELEYLLRPNQTQQSERPPETEPEPESEPQLPEEESPSSEK
ncbi:unnamed protein product [Knipowitschia caucasica]|uniref:Coiled-coil domain containing 32 n=1 Tax=Knipowitschia caucasica TaxID=637954 RepID=A0AAV2JBZ1_KNICA